MASMTLDISTRRDAVHGKFAQHRQYVALQGALRFIVVEPLQASCRFASQSAATDVNVSSAAATAAARFTAFS